MKITILIDNPKSWFMPFGERMAALLSDIGHQCRLVTHQEKIGKGDICFLLSCLNIVSQDFLRRNCSNIVVHASDLPKGKGFSPLQWQILEGKKTITLTLFEAIKELDAGPYYFKEKVRFKGTEMLEELHSLLGEKIIHMCIDYVANYGKIKPKKQRGQHTFYRKRTSSDDELDITKTLKYHFNHFRIADNNKYPLYFRYKNKKFIVKIYPEKE